MRIAYVYDAVYPYIKGGAEKRIYEIGKRLAARGHEVHWYGVKWWEGEEVIQLDGITLHGVCKSKGLYTREGRRSIQEAIYFAVNVFRPLLKEDFDVIDVGNFPYIPAFSCKLISKIKKTPLIITWHEVWDGYWYEYLGAKGFFGKIIEKAVTKLPDKHISVSKRTMEDLSTLGVNNEKIRVVQNGIDFKAIQKIPPNKDECDVLFGGRLIKDKNVDVLIEAIGQLKKRLSDIKCRIIGEGPERENLVSLAGELDLTRNVEFLDFLDYDDFIGHIKSSNLFVLPSTREGFGIVLLEAMASQTPVIAVKSERSAASEIVNGENGFLCELDGLEENIMHILNDKKLRASLINAGVEYSKDWDWNVISDELLEIYGNKLK